VTPRWIQRLARDCREGAVRAAWCAEREALQRIADCGLRIAESGKPLTPGFSPSDPDTASGLRSAREMEAEIPEMRARVSAPMNEFEFSNLKPKPPLWLKILRKLLVKW
jgi:hypothetical protein